MYTGIVTFHIRCFFALFVYVLPRIKPWKTPVFTLLEREHKKKYFFIIKEKSITLSVRIHKPYLFF